MTMQAEIQLPDKLLPVFSGAARYRVAHGGRGSGKTKAFAKMAAMWGYIAGKSGRVGVILCGREHLNSLDDSSMAEVKEAIQSEPFLASYYEMGEKYIRSRDGRIRFLFVGLRHNLDSVKSKASILLAWVDEAESVSEQAWRKLVPTVRTEGSEIWVTYNPESPESATHRRFRAVQDDSIKIAELNWRDNPWFPDVLNDERKRDQEYRPDVYGHIWEGDFLSQTDVQVFAGKWRVQEFEPQQGWAGPYFGMDFGFRPDPLAAVKVWVHDESLWIEKEAYANNVEIDATADFVSRHMPEIAQHVVRADSAEPKTISYLQRHGLPRIEPVKKWPNSVEEGIRFIRGFKSVIIHPRCTGSARDFRLYSHKVDRMTGDILPDVLDADNHAPDAVRYAIAPLIKQQGAGKMVIRI
jgi:phage terminase large subunit